MRCFYHSEAEAVALCKHCYRGLCRECAADTPAGTACRGRCEEEVRDLGLVMDASKQMVLGRHGSQRAGFLFATSVGGVFSVAGLMILVFAGSRLWPLAAFVLAIGLAFVWYGVASLRAWRARQGASASV
jgi:hypothetical protein